MSSLNNTDQRFTRDSHPALLDKSAATLRLSDLLFDHTIDFGRVFKQRRHALLISFIPQTDKLP